MPCPWPFRLGCLRWQVLFAGVAGLVAGFVPDMWQVLCLEVAGFVREVRLCRVPDKFLTCPYAVSLTHS